MLAAPCASVQCVGQTKIDTTARGGSGQWAAFCIALQAAHIQAQHHAGILIDGIAVAKIQIDIAQSCTGCVQAVATAGRLARRHAKLTLHRGLIRKRQASATEDAVLGSQHHLTAHTQIQSHALPVTARAEIEVAAQGDLRGESVASECAKGVAQRDIAHAFEIGGIAFFSTQIKTHTQADPEGAAAGHLVAYTRGRACKPAVAPARGDDGKRSGLPVVRTQISRAIGKPQAQGHFIAFLEWEFRRQAHVLRSGWRHVSDAAYRQESEQMVFHCRMSARRAAFMEMWDIAARAVPWR
jgi:hypothetical protein